MLTRRELLALLLGTLLLSGCPAAIVAHQMRKRREGTVEASYQAPHKRLYEATLAALGDLDMTVGTITEKPGGTTISATSGDGGQVIIDLTSISVQATRLKVVASRGHELLAPAVAERVSARLGAQGQASPSQPSETPPPEGGSAQPQSPPPAAPESESVQPDRGRGQRI